MSLKTLDESIEKVMESVTIKYMILRELELGDEVAFESMLDAWDGAPGFSLAFGLLEDASFAAYLSFLKDSRDGVDLTQGHVPSSSLFAFIGNEIVGKVSIRHELNPHLEKVGGHIGYGVLPLHRGKGYASVMLKLALDYCRRLGFKRVLLTCDETNKASARVIEKNGGVLENVYDPNNGTSKKCRYWIEL